MEVLKRSVYIWEWPIRIYHWLNVILMVILIITGLYIGAPVFSSPGEAYSNFIMGKVRYWHALAAWIFIANWIFRFYWAFVGNEYAKFKPWRKGFFADGLETTKYYLFLKKEHTVHGGHNVVAQLTYFLFMWVGSFFMIITGFALQGEINPGGFQERFMGWLIPLFSNSYNLRSYHHLAAWAFIVFIIAHLYLVIRQDILDDDGTVSSIISGHKYLLADGEGEHDKD